MIDESGLVEIFERVRRLPYDTVAAHDAAGLRVEGRGNFAAGWGDRPVDSRHSPLRKARS